MKAVVWIIFCCVIPLTETGCVDGTECLHDTFTWKEEFGACSVSCGVGEQHNWFSCRSASSNLTVDLGKCSEDSRPEPNVRPCYLESCQGASPRWIFSLWHRCSASCGAGVMARSVHCVMMEETGKFLKVADEKCSTRRPQETRECQTQKCPSWVVRDWSECSVSCGHGNQKRVVTCESDLSCPQGERPPDTRLCYSFYPTCPKGTNYKLTILEAPEVKHDTPQQFQYGDRKSTDPRQEVRFDTSKTLLLKSLDDDKPRYMEVANGKDTLGVIAQQSDTPVAIDVPRYHSGDWGECNASCGVGVRRRLVVCQVFLEFTQLMQNLPDAECYGPKPRQEEACYGELCGSSSIYRWKFKEFGDCSATCLGGVQLPVYVCELNDGSDEGIVVPDVMCVELPIPTQLVPKPCNDVPCPPRWRIGEYAACSATCGIGAKTRTVECIQELSLKEKYRILGDQFCDGSTPRREEVCDMGHCLVKWTVENWSKCSASCGEGIQIRRVYCVTPGDCLAQEPTSKRLCQMDPCPLRVKTYVQMKPMQQVYLHTGGGAILLQNSSVLIKCKSAEPSGIEWTKDGVELHRIGRVRVSRSGKIRIRRIKRKDAGVYTCRSGQRTDSIVISFQTENQAAVRLAQRQKYLNPVDTPKLMKPSRGSNATVTWHDTTSSVQFVASEWTPCSSQCNGMQTRTVTCEVIFSDHYLITDDQMCSSEDKLQATRSCGLPSCPEWMIESWGECSSSLCVRHHVGTKKRNVVCVAGNGTSMPSELCDVQKKPSHKRECEQLECVATWKTTDWTQCFPHCAPRGFKSRALKCVWIRNKEPAGAACQGRRRPVVRKPCRRKPCNLRQVCHDSSKYCSLLPIMKMCRFKQYQEKCCKSCSTPLARYKDQRKRLYWLL